MPILIEAERLLQYKANGISELTEWQKGWNDAIDTIIDEAPTVEAIPIEWINKWVNNYCDRNQEKLIECLLRTWEKETEPVRHGHWVHGKELSRDYIGGVCVSIHYDKCWCSECNYTVEGHPLWMYCPICGAKMDEVEE